MPLGLEVIENIRRLALGIEPMDFLRRRACVRALRVDIERGLPHAPRTPERQYCFTQQPGRAPQTLCRHNSGRYSVLYHPSLQETIALRIYDHERYYVPRRLLLPLLTEAQVIALEAAQSRDYDVGRVRYPVMFPGAGYDMTCLMTGLRGRVMRNGAVMRWAHVEAHIDDGAVLVGRARGDERGEFLLLLDPTSAPASDLAATIDVRVTVYGPAVEPVSAVPMLAELDGLWDLPQEVVPPIPDPDSVSPGEVPDGYVPSAAATRNVAFLPGRMLTGVEVDDFVFSLP